MSILAINNNETNINTAFLKPTPPKQGCSAFANILGQQLNQMIDQGRAIEGNMHEAVMGRGGLEHIAQDFSEFIAQFEAIKSIADAGISAVKQLSNTAL